MSHLKNIKPSPNLWSFFKELENDGVFVGFSTSRISSSRDTPWFHVFHVCCLRCALPESRGWKTWRRYSSCHHYFCFWQATLPGSLGIYVEIRISIIMLKYSHSKPSNIYIPPKNAEVSCDLSISPKLALNFLPPKLVWQIRHAQADVWSMQDVGNGLKRSKSSMAPPSNGRVGWIVDRVSIPKKKFWAGGPPVESLWFCLVYVESRIKYLWCDVGL